MTFNNLFSPHSCQEVVLDSMSLGPNIARNAALRENVFMIAICIELRIPLFLVGKPGSSKSLAKSIVQTSMQGTASNSELLKGFKQVSTDIYRNQQVSGRGSSLTQMFSQLCADFDLANLVIHMTQGFVIQGWLSLDTLG